MLHPLRSNQSLAIFSPLAMRGIIASVIDTDICPIGIEMPLKPRVVIGRDELRGTPDMAEAALCLKMENIKQNEHW